MGFFKHLIDSIHDKKMHKLDLKWAHKDHDSDNEYSYKKDAVEHGVDPDAHKGQFADKIADIAGNLLEHKAPGAPGSPDATAATVGFSFAKNMPLILLAGGAVAFLVFGKKKGRKR